ncbi:MAG: trigger factor [Lachnospiraceae bacterium]|nr:trigger factor [Lachnospiraceae bacterium]
MSEDNLLKDAVSDVEDAAENAADQAGDAVKDAADQAVDAVKDDMDQAVDAVKDVVDQAGETIGDVAENAVKGLNETIVSAGEKIAEQEAGAVVDAEETVNNTLAGAVLTSEDLEKNSETSAVDSEVTEKINRDNKIGEGNNIEKVSRKTTVVLICTIIVLVALIVVFAVLIGRKYFAGKNKETGNNDPEVTSVVDNDANNQTVTDTPSVTSSVNDDTDTAAIKEYDVTVELGQYKGLEIDFPEINISEEDIDNELEYFVEDLAEDVPVDRPSQNGDMLNINYVGYMNGEEFEGGKDEGVDFELGAGYFFDAFEEGLVGKEVGEHTLDLNFPDDYYEDLAGKPVTFVVTINSISETVVPELTDQLIADNTDCSTIEEYRAFIRGELTEEAEADAEEHLERDILYLAIGNATFGGEIDEEIDDLTQQYFDYYDQMAQSYYGMTGAELFNVFYGMTEEDYSATLKEESSYSIKVQHLLDKIAEEENLGYTEEEYKEEFEEIFFSYYGFTEEAEVKEQLSDEEIDKIVIRSIKQKKAQAIIIDSAIVNR